MDRGSWGLETLLLFLAYKWLLPNNVYLLRGWVQHTAQLAQAGVRSAALCLHAWQCFQAHIVTQASA